MVRAWRTTPRTPPESWPVGKATVGTWDFDTSILYSEVKVKEDLKSGFPLYSEIMPFLDSGIINPFGPTTDPSAMAAAKAANSSVRTAVQDLAHQLVARPCQLRFF